mgnify:CR=1 FL=1
MGAERRGSAVQSQAMTPSLYLFPISFLGSKDIGAMAVKFVWTFEGRSAVRQSDEGYGFQAESVA